MGDNRLKVIHTNENSLEDVGEEMNTVLQK